MLKLWRTHIITLILEEERKFQKPDSKLQKQRIQSMKLAHDKLTPLILTHSLSVSKLYFVESHHQWQLEEFCKLYII